MTDNQRPDDAIDGQDPDTEGHIVFRGLADEPDTEGHIVFRGVADEPDTEGNA
jgi:hypothetical protein